MCRRRPTAICFAGGRGSPAPGTLATATTRKAPVGPPIFIHSSWRSSSTWFWSKFRELPGTTAYFEPFSELNTTLTPTNVPGFDSTVWESRHPKIASYLLEYLPLLRRSKGVRLYQQRMAYDWFIAKGGLDGTLRDEETRYLAFLLRHAARHGQVPVLGFVRSLGRAAAIKKCFAGVHILQLRNLWPQWQSYLSYKRRDDPVFYNTAPAIIAHADDDAYLVALRNRYLGQSSPGAAGRDGPARSRLLRALPEPDVFALFMALHVYLYLHAERIVDCVVDVTRAAHQPDYLAAIEQELRARCGLQLSLSDVRDERQPDDPNFGQRRGELANDSMRTAIRPPRSWLPATTRTPSCAAPKRSSTQHSGKQRLRMSPRRHRRLK